MKMKKMIYLAFALLFMSATSMKAQVAIGTENPDMNPHPGAILDLGQVKANNLGLLLPQVKLTDAKIWAPVVGETKDEVDGMLVYNDNDDATIENGLKGKGAYVWYDNSWNKIGAASFICGDKLKDIDGNTYATAYFSVAGCWMQENLRTTNYADGTAIDLKSGSNSDIDKKEYAYPNNDADNMTRYGLLYTWAAASNRTDIDDNEGNNSTQARVKGVCPEGWHLPSDYEWSQLEKVIAMDGAKKYSSDTYTNWDDKWFNTTDFRGFYHGMKMRRNAYVNGTYNNGTSNSVDDNGFVALTVGAVTKTKDVDSYGTAGFFWSSSSANADKGWIRYVSGANNGGNRTNYFGKTTLFSVRCKKDRKIDILTF